MRTLLLLCWITLFISCKDDREYASVIYHNARVWTGNPAQPYVTCIAVKDRTIIYTGTADHLPQGPSTRMVNLEGRLVVPGMIDNHTHFLSGGYALTSVNLRPAKSREDFIRILKAYCQQYPDDRWIMGGNWDHEAWGGTLPEKEWIDSVCGKHPIFLSRYDGHMAFANSRALELAGLTAQTPVPEGGAIEKNKQGVLTGILRDEAMALVDRVIPPPTEKELDEFFERAQQEAIAHGITQVTDMGGYGGWTDLMTYRRNYHNHKLKLRVYAFVPLTTWPRLDSFCKANGKGDDLLHWGGLKGFVDGSLGSTTAWFYQPYLDAPHTKGLTVIDTLKLSAAVTGADQAGLQVAIHAIGDRANDYILGVYAAAERQNGSRDRRFRIEHAQHLSSDALTHIPRQAVIPSMQPYHAIDDGKWAYKRLEDRRLLGTYAFNTLLRGGAGLTFGSDWPVAPLDPIQGIYAAVTRRTLDDKNPDGWYPAEKISVEQALRCYTSNNAFASFQESTLGMIKAGLLADFVVLSDNLLEIAPAKIREVKVIRTIIDGKEVYVSPGNPQ